MEIKLPELGENIEEAEVLTVLVGVGEQIEADQSLLELETDKATVEVPSPSAGVVRAIRVAPGDTIRIGQAIIEIDTGDGEAVAPPEAKAEKPKKSPPKAKAAPKPEAEPTPEPEVAQEPEAAEPEDEAEAEPAESNRPRVVQTHTTGPAAAAPAVHRLARELGLDLAELPGSGPGGRISMDDVKEHARRIITGKLEHKVDAPSLPAGFMKLPDFEQFGAVEREHMKGVRRKTAENMTRSWVTIPHVTQFDRADINTLERARKRFQPQAEQAGGKLTVTSIVIKVLASAIRQFPKLNASIDIEREEIVYKKYVNVGLAVDTPHGLLVPVIRDVDEKSLIEISTELTDLSERARNRKVRPDELRGASITVTNLGGLGTTYFTPLINWPEVAVLGVGRARTEPVFREGEFIPKLILPLSISYDHRLIDGADAARFLRWIAEALESPIPLALES